MMNWNAQFVEKYAVVANLSDDCHQNKVVLVIAAHRFFFKEAPTQTCKRIWNTRQLEASFSVNILTISQTLLIAVYKGIQYSLHISSGVLMVKLVQLPSSPIC